MIKELEALERRVEKLERIHKVKYRVSKVSLARPIDSRCMKAISTIQGIVANESGVTVVDITGRSRVYWLTEIRHIAMYITNSLLGDSWCLQDIGKCFGNRDHTSVLYAISRMNGLIDTEPKVKARVEMLLEKCREALQ